MAGALVQLIGVITLSEFLANRYGKKSTFIVCLGLTALFTAAFMLPDKDDVGLIFTLGIFKEFGVCAYGTIALGHDCRCG